MNQEPTILTIFGIEIEQRAIIRFFLLIVLIALIWLIGPMVLILAWLIENWAAAEYWRARSRWASVGGFAWFFGGITVILLIGSLFPIPILSPLLSSIWQHLPIWGTMHEDLIRWIIALPLAPVLAIALELVRRRTIWYVHRGLTDAERTQLQAQEEKRQAAAQAKAARAKQKNTPSTPTTQSQATARDRIVTSYLAQDENPSKPQSQSAQPKHSAASSASLHEQTIQQETLWTTANQEANQETSAPSAPTPQEQPAPKKYDWNQGEGSLKDL